MGAQIDALLDQNVKAVAEQMVEQLLGLAQPPTLNHRPITPGQPHPQGLIGRVQDLFLGWKNILGAAVSGLHDQGIAEHCFQGFIDGTGPALDVPGVQQPLSSRLRLDQRLR